MKSIAVYCGASMGNDPIFAQRAKELGKTLAERRISLVYGGGGIGLMGTIADAVLEKGGKVIGVIPKFLLEHELGHQSATELIIVDTMHERKRRMIELSEGFIAMPGGYGTLEELGEVLAWSQLGLHRGPCGVLNVNGYYDGLILCADRMCQDGLLMEQDRQRLLSDESCAGLLEKMVAWEPPTTLKVDYLKPKDL